MTDEKTRALIAEARGRASLLREESRPDEVSPGDHVLDMDADLFDGLADALESALTVPDGDVREAVEEEATRRWGEFASTDTRQGAFERDAFVAGAMWALSRAAAPEPKVITTPEEELDLQPGTVVRFADGHAAELSLYGSHPRQWYCFGRYYLTAFPEDLLPATVIYEPLPVGGEAGGE